MRFVVYDKNFLVDTKRRIRKVWLVAQLLKIDVSFTKFLFTRKMQLVAFFSKTEFLVNKHKAAKQKNKSVSQAAFQSSACTTMSVPAAAVSQASSSAPHQRFTAEEDEKIIDLVRENECLYNLAHKMYKNNDFKHRLWCELADKLNRDGEYF